MLTANSSLIRALFLGSIASLFFPTASAASELVSLLEILRDNGTIDSQQYSRLMQEIAQGSGAAASRAKHALATPVTGADPQAPSPQAAAPSARPRQDTTAPRPSVDTKGGLAIRSADDDFTFELGGSLWLDAATFNEDRASLGNGAEFRRARIGMKGRLFRDWGYVAKLEFADGEAEVKNAYLSYRGFEPFSLRLGQFKGPFSLEEQTSGKNLVFMERALPVDAFSPGRNIGFGLFAGRQRWSAAAGLFTDGDGGDGIDAGWSASARGTYALHRTDRKLLHVGASIDYGRTDEEDEMRFRAGLESSIADQRLVDTGTIENATGRLGIGFEGASVLGPVTLQGEYIRTGVDRDQAQPDLQFSGWYVSTSWMITGETRRYDGPTGRFKRIEPAASSGAWELALRYSSIDLDDGDISGGKQRNLSLGLNWHLNPNIRFMANYIDVRADPDKDGGRDEPSLFQVRAQLDF